MNYTEAENRLLKAMDKRQQFARKHRAVLSKWDAFNRGIRRLLARADQAANSPCRRH